MRRVAFIVLLAIAATPVLAVEPPAWPDLPKSGFIIGRVATDRDVVSGEAVFSRGASPGTASALDLAIPQYGCWKQENGPPKRVVLLQAEGSVIGDLVGLRDTAGETIAATRAEVTLLGTIRPDNKDCR